MQFGYFDDEHREYVITRPDTPLPWINYLGCENYFGIISNTAGGYSFYKDARLRRLTRYRYNNSPLDSGGRYIYLRDDSRPHPCGPLFWSPTWQPTRQPLDFYECRHGLGYTIIRSRLAGVEAKIRYFVPLGESLETWELTLANRRDQTANLSIFSAIEFWQYRKTHYGPLAAGSAFQRRTRFSSCAFDCLAERVCNLKRARWVRTRCCSSRTWSPPAPQPRSRLVRSSPTWWRNTQTIYLYQ